MPEDANADYNLGIELDELGRHSDALIEYEKAARLKPRNADIQFNLGNGYHRAQQYAKAAKPFLS
jgi:tetratricopeptide (TPR) repeat protein